MRPYRGRILFLRVFRVGLWSGFGRVHRRGNALSFCALSIVFSDNPSAGLSQQMLFNSIPFAIFLPITFALYWMCRSNHRVQNILLLVASYVFYGWWDWRFLFLIAGCSFVNYLSGRFIYQSQSRFVRRLWLTLCCIVSLGTLGVFKYFDFFVSSLAELFSCIGINWTPWVWNLVLPVGISFFTFQALSYTIDITLGKIKPTNSLVEFFTFIAFFPQLVAGPIERACNLLPQFCQERRFNFDAAAHGVCLISFGLFKKMVVADTLGQYVDNVWADPMFYSSVTCIVGAVFFAVQIYCDFSGYSDVARGVAKLFGFELMLNFDSPYLSRSFSAFWRRWHISLSSWFRDYVYIPMGGNRVALVKLLRNLWVVFLLSGLWHGASWAFVAWGAIHALYLSLGVLKNRFCGRNSGDNIWTKVISILIVDVGVVFAWIFFRAGTIEGALGYLKALCRCKWDTSLMAWCAGLGPLQFGFCIVVATLFVLSTFCPRDCGFVTTWAKFVFSILCIVTIVFIGMPSGGEFIYFKF